MARSGQSQGASDPIRMLLLRPSDGSVGGDHRHNRGGARRESAGSRGFDLPPSVAVSAYRFSANAITLTAMALLPPFGAERS